MIVVAQISLVCGISSVLIDKNVTSPPCARGADPLGATLPSNNAFHGVDVRI